HRELEALEIAVGKQAGSVVGLIAHADLIKQCERLATMLLCRRPPGVEQPLGLREQHHLHVFAHAHRAKASRDLERATHAEAPHLPRVASSDVTIIQGHLAAVGAQLPVQQVEASDLPATLGPMSASSSPDSTSNDTSSTARTPPKALERLRTWRRLIGGRP